MKKVVSLLGSLLLTSGLLLIPSAAQADTRYFASSDPFNLGVSANAPTQYSNSSSLAQTFGSTAYDANVATGTNGVTIKQADSTTPHYQITGKQTGWGPNPFTKDVYWDNSWPIPNSADGWVVSIAPDKSYATECWKAQIVNGKLTCQWGAQSNPSGSSTDVNGAPTGSGIARLAGVITQDDWDNGIDHALNYGTPDNSGTFIYPATKTDGSGSGTMHEGDFIWMDSGCHPTGLTTAQQRIFDALQKYGAFNVDNAATFGFASESGATAPGGNNGGWLNMKGLPWASCLHVGKVTKGGTPAPTSASPSPTPTQTTPSPTPTTTSPSPTVSPTDTPTAKLAAGNVCRVSSTDKRNWWSVANLGNSVVSYTSYVAYSGTNTTGPSGSINPGQVVSLRTANGGGLHVKYAGTEATATSNAKITCN